MAYFFSTVDYRHVIHSLVKKPQAFRYSQIRDNLLPTPHYKAIWSYLDETLSPKESCKIIVGLLHLAATQECEDTLAEIVLGKCEGNEPIVLDELQKLFQKKPIPPPPEINIEQHRLGAYDHLIPQNQEVQYA